MVSGKPDLPESGFFGTDDDDDIDISRVCVQEFEELAMAAESVSNVRICCIANADPSVDDDGWVNM